MDQTVQEFWEDEDREIKKYWEDENTQSMSDPRIAELEARALEGRVKPSDIVLDIGCGSGDGAKYVMEKCKQYVGFERSKTMVKKFKEKWDHEIVEGDMRDIPENLNGKFSVVICQRSLINLETKEEQLAVLKRIPQLLKPHGRIILCEAFEEGLETLNYLRKKLDLDEMKPRWHNLYLTNKLVIEALQERRGAVAFFADFSLYYLITRVLRAAVEYPNIPTEDSKLNEVAQKIQEEKLFAGWELFATGDIVGPVKVQEWAF